VFVALARTKSGDEHRQGQGEHAGPAPGRPTDPAVGQPRAQRQGEEQSGNQQWRDQQQRAVGQREGLERVSDDGRTGAGPPQWPVQQRLDHQGADPLIGGNIHRGALTHHDPDGGEHRPGEGGGHDERLLEHVRPFPLQRNYSTGLCDPFSALW